MRRSLATLTVIVLSLVMVVDARAPGDQSAPNPPRLEWKEFKALYDSKKLVVIDVRAPEAFAAGHIPGARSMPMKVLAADVAALQKLSVPLVLYCNCGADEASSHGALILRAKGLNAYVLAGGYRRWIRETKGDIEKS